MAEPVRKMPADREPESTPSDDPFRYGYRIQSSAPGGEVDWIPLTAEDLLDPQFGDHVTQGGQHFSLVHLLVGTLRRHFESREDIYVASDLKMLWGIPGVKRPAPDAAVITGLPRKPDPEPDSWDVVREGARPCLIIEVVSSKDAKTRSNDYDRKVPIYQRAGVPEYLILDPPTRATKGRFLLTGYRLDAKGRYRTIEPNSAGYLLSETTQLLFGVAEDGRSPSIIDAATGQRLLADHDIEAARQSAENRAAAAEAELARLREEVDRLKNR
jgi:Uma2 family endonuclease